MAIKKTYSPPITPDDYRMMLQPFIHDESGTKALQQYIDQDNKITREGMYLLEILNNVINTQNGTEKVFQRIPQELFGGLSEGGRKNVEATLLVRAVRGSGREESKGIRPSGYTGIQEVIGQWAERDGCWSDTPENDLTKKGYIHKRNIDGSEARVFALKDEAQRLYKTIDFSHYSDFELMMDRIAIHNATFPEMAMKVEGFGMRDDTSDNPETFNEGFVVVISQPTAIGTKPTMGQIQEGMKERFFELSNNGFFWINGLDNFVVADIHDMNAVMSPEGHLLVYDCEAFLKTFQVEIEQPERISLNRILPDKNGKYDETTWKEILGDTFKQATEQDISQLVLELRRTGKINGLVNGKNIMMDRPRVNFKTLPDGNIERYFEGDVLVGRPRAFQSDHLWTVPELQYDERNVQQITSVINHLMPTEMDLEQFLFSQKYVGAVTASYRGGGDYRQNYKEQLMSTGRIDELVNNRYVVQLNPQDKSQVLISTPEQISFMLWTNNAPLDNNTKLPRLTPEMKKDLAKGKSISTPQGEIRFNLDKGRVELTDKVQIKKRQKIDINEKPIKAKPQIKI